MALSKEDYITKWKGEFNIDEKLQNVSENFEKWFAQIPETYKPIVKTLLENFDYYSRKTTNKWLKKLHTDLISDKNVTDNNTIYAFIKSRDGKSNSSNDYWTEYKTINEVNSEICYENMDEILDEQWGFIDNIVFVDDFSGSGKSFIDELKKYPGRYKNKNIYFIAIDIMFSALEEIKAYGLEAQINIVLLVAIKQMKAFERHLFDDEEAAKLQVVRMSKDFLIPKKEHLGFCETQALVGFYNNTPNNTLGFIRYDTVDGYKSLFPRKNDKKPSWQTMNGKSKNRKIANYNNSINNGG